MFIYSIYDKKGCTHVREFFIQNDASAVRAFGTLANDSRTDIGQYPDDFALYCIGEFDFNTGVITNITPVKFVCDASSLLKVSETIG